jgi:CheY-like chemotaxis protein
VDLPQESASEPVAPGAASGKRVLYLDDDEALVSVVTRTLRRQGIQVEGHGDPAQALARLCANPQEFDLLVSDYNMPGMSGLEVTRAVKALCPRLPVVLISGFIDEALRAQAWDAGVSELFHKADSAEEFSMMVERALKGVIRSH